LTVERSSSTGIGGDGSTNRVGFALDVDVLDAWELADFLPDTPTSMTIDYPIILGHYDRSHKAVSPDVLKESVVSFLTRRLIESTEVYHATCSPFLSR
jgi:hypothetical protein